MSGNPKIKSLQELNEEIHSKAYSYNHEDNRWNYDQEIADELTEIYKEHIQKLNDVSVVYTKADSIITGDDITVSVTDDKAMETTAYNDGKKIVFNANLLEDLDDYTITSLHGFNYHEVAHVLYSPRAGSELGKWIIANKVKRAYNMLEDSRIERLITAKYPSTRLYLEACITDYMLKGDSDEWWNYFPLITGRKYLDIELRQEVATRFVNKAGEQVAEDIASIIHEYRTLVLPADKDKAMELISRFAKYTGLDEQGEGEGEGAEGEGGEGDSPTIKPMNAGVGHSDRDIQNKGRLAGTQEQRRIQERAEQMERGSGSEYFEKSLDVDDVSNTDNPTNQQAETTESDREMRDRLNKKLEQIINHEQVKQGTSEVRKALDQNTEQNSLLGNSSYSIEEVGSVNKELAQRFAYEMETLRIENDPMWKLEVPTGRLNITRTMNANINDIDRLFDRWDIGNDNRDIEAVILVDNSGSMSYHMNRTLEAMWIIKRGIEAIDGRVTVYRFNDYSKLVYGADEPADPTTYRSVRSGGGTNPYEALHEAERILGTSDKGIKILFTVSDGAWSNETINNEIIQRMNENIEGLVSVAVFIGDLRWYRENYEPERYDEIIKSTRHNCQVFHTVAEPRDLIEVATKVVTSTMTPIAH